MPSGHFVTLEIAMVLVGGGDGAIFNGGCGMMIIRRCYCCVLPERDGDEGGKESEGRSKLHDGAVLFVGRLLLLLEWR
jgi:hypothetical protein